MSSNFARAMKEINEQLELETIANAKAKSDLERERLDRASKAWALAEPYLRSLGKAVVRELLSSNIRPETMNTPSVRPLPFWKQREVIRWWSFLEPAGNEPKGSADYPEDTFVHIHLLEDGTFVSESPSVITDYSLIRDKKERELANPSRLRALRDPNYTRRSKVYFWNGIQPEQIRPALHRLNDNIAERSVWGEWLADGFDRSRTFVDPDSHIVYVLGGPHTFKDVPSLSLKDDGYIQELSIYIARHIQYRLQTRR